VASRPHILLVDLLTEAETQLAARGFNATSGSLGRAFRIERDNSLLAVPLAAKLPGFTEVDIAIIDFAVEVSDEVPALTQPVIGESEFFQSRAGGVIDPRPRVANYVAKRWDRVHEHGGIFCVFADEPFPVKYAFGEQTYRGVDVQRAVEMSVWDLVSPLKQLRRGADHGEDITPTSAAEELGLAQLLRGRFTCTFEHTGKEGHWLPLATNRWGATVDGFVVVLPQIHDKLAAIDWIVDDLAPRLSPHLFPDRGTGAWRDRPTYELTHVQGLRKELGRQREEAVAAEAAMLERIDAARAEDAWLLDLLDGTDDMLVQAVKRALEECGLEDVRDADAELMEDDPGSGRREDLRVHDRSPLLLVEVKGITRQRPTEAEILQVGKYLAPRMRALDRTDIVGLTVINNERHLPPEQRTNDIFGDDVVEAARAQDISLLRALDLYRLARGAVEHGWSAGTLIDRLWSSGVLDGRPTHYTPLGTITNIFAQPEVIAIELSLPLEVGERLGFELPLNNAEVVAASLEQDRQQVGRADPGSTVAVHVGELTAALRSGMAVYHVGSSDAPTG
jgi:hypothetical protein